MVFQIDLYATLGWSDFAFLFWMQAGVSHKVSLDTLITVSKKKNHFFRKKSWPAARFKIFILDKISLWGRPPAGRGLNCMPTSISKRCNSMNVSYPLYPARGSYDRVLQKKKRPCVFLVHHRECFLQKTTEAHFTNKFVITNV